MLDLGRIIYLLKVCVHGRQMVSLVSLLFLLLVKFAAAQNPFQISLWHPLALGADSSKKALSLSLPQSGVYSLSGLGLALVGSEVTQFRGLQCSGVYSYLRDDGRGLMFSGLANVARGNMKGMEASFMINLNVGTFKGVQLSGVSNMSIKQFRGMQLSAISNVAASSMSGFQWSGVSNITAKGTRALQWAGLFNISIESMKGAQMAMGNFADTISGLQLGLVNVASKVKKGVQLGLINFHDDSTGLHIGLVNMTPRSRLQLMLFAGNFTGMNVAGRIKNKHDYLIFGMGSPYDINMSFSGSIFVRRGYTIAIKSLSLNADMGAASILAFDQQIYKDKPLQKLALQGRLSVEYQIRKRLACFIGGGYSLAATYGSTIRERKPIFEAGVVLF